MKPTKTLIVNQDEIFFLTRVLKFAFEELNRRGNGTNIYSEELKVAEKLLKELVDSK